MDEKSSKFRRYMQAVPLRTWVFWLFWEGKVSLSALTPPQTQLLTSVRQLVDWRENIPAPSLPHPPFPYIHSILHHTIPTTRPASQLSNVARAAPACHGWFRAEVGEGCESGRGGRWVMGVMRLDVKNVAHGLLFCVFCVRWIGRRQAGVLVSCSSLLTFVLPEGPGLPRLKSDTPMMKAAGPTSSAAYRHNNFEV